MSRVRYGSRAGNRLPRRRVLAIAATVGVGVSAASWAGLSLAGEQGGDGGDGDALVLSLKNAEKGTFDVFSGEKKVTIEDKDLVKKLLEALKEG